MDATTPSSGDIDGLGTVAVASLSDDLQPIIPLFLDVKLRERVLARFGERERLAAEEIFQCGIQLSEMTAWSQARLLEALGCTIKTVGEFHDAELDGLERCANFLRLVTRHTGLVDTDPDRREVVVESARLLKAIGGDAHRLRALFATKDGQYSAIDYIRLGEIEEASEHVRRFAGLTPVDESAEGDDPFADVPAVHLSATRIDMLIGDERDMLGVEVANHMEAHIEKCDGCRDAFEDRRARLAA
jgi:hypothetical protein